MTASLISAIVFALLAVLPAGARAGETPCLTDSCHGALEAVDGPHSSLRPETCRSCHRPGPGYAPEKHGTSSFDDSFASRDSCASCHKRWTAPGPFPDDHENSVGECVSCHRGHASSFPYLLQASYPSSSYATFDIGLYDLCWTCHDSALATKKFTDETGFRQGKRNFHYSHLHKRKGMTCRICHEPHGDGQPFMIRKSLHRDDAGWRGEMQFLPSAHGGTCRGGCHKDLSYRR